MAINTTKEDEELKESVKIQVVLRLFKYLIKYRLKIVAVILMILGTVAIGIAYPLIVQRLLDVEIANKDTAGMLRLGIFALGLAVLSTVLAICWRRMMAKISNTIICQIRRELYIHLQTLGFDFYDSRPAGKILARVTGDVNSLKDVLSSTVTQLVPELVTIIVVLVVMISVSPVLTLSAVATMPILIGGIYVCEIVAHRRWQVLRKKESNMTAFIHEDLEGTPIVQSFGATSESEEEFDRIINDHRSYYKYAVRIAFLFSPTVELAFGLGNFILYFLAIKVVGIEVASIGTISAFAMYMGMFWGPIRNLANYYNKLVTNLTAAERVFEIMDIEATIKDYDGASELESLSGAVEFENVVFAYPDEPERKVLDGVNFSITPGETIALVGPTGAGKTTIVSLIARFYDCVGGRVLLDGRDVRDFTLESLRSKMGIMTQDNFLFSGTIMENIRYGKLDATDEEIIAAAKTVHAHDFIIRLKDGYQTVITERGGGLSIGQRQLIAFARTLVSDPSILILDEATSSIDTHTEILVQQGIEELLRGRTAFVVAHRLSTIRNADRIFVVDDGGIIEEGNHEQLMEKRGKYYGLYAAQMGSEV